MAIGLVGRKCGMTRVFTDAGESVPVTVVELLPNRVTQLKTTERDGYRAVQVTYGTRRPQLLGKALAGHYAKANVAPGRGQGGAQFNAGLRFSAVTKQIIGARRQIIPGRRLASDGAFNMPPRFLYGVPGDIRMGIDQAAIGLDDLGDGFRRLQAAFDLECANTRRHELRQDRRGAQVAHGIQ